MAALTSNDHCISVSPCERPFLWMMTSLRRRRLWLRPRAKSWGRSSRNWRGAVCGAKGKPPARAVCQFFRCRPMLRSSRAIARGSCSPTTRRETSSARYQCPARARLAQPPAPRRSSSLVSRGIQKRMGDLCADPARVRPSFLQSRLHPSSRSSAAGGGAAQRAVDSQTASLLAFARRQKPCDLPSSSRSSASQRCLPRCPGSTTARPSRHARYQAAGPCRGRRSGLGYCVLIGLEERE